MASKLIALDEAAKILGVSAAELNDMRQRQEIYGYRDGASWKFKSEDVERLREERGAASPSAGKSASDSSIDFNFDDSGITATKPKPMASDSGLPIDLGDSADDVVLLSELELGESGSKSTVIGKSGGEMQAVAGDIGPGSDLELAGSDVRLVDSDINLAESDVRLAEPEDVVPLGSGSQISGDESKTVVKSGAKGDSSVKLAGDEADVLAGGTGSDITVNPGDSGIFLVDPSDSGLSLSEPIDLGEGSKDELQPTTDFDSDSLMEMKEDDDFLLTPLEEATDEESDSGSQVIALDTEGEFEEATATLLASQVPGLGSVLEEEALGEVGGGPLAGGLAAAGVAPVRMVRYESQFTALDVGLLTVGVVLMTVSSILVYDLVRVMATGDAPYPLSSTILSLFV